jgi:hypothetical protein
MAPVYTRLRVGAADVNSKLINVKFDVPRTTFIIEPSHLPCSARLFLAIFPLVTIVGGVGLFSAYFGLLSLIVVADRLGSSTSTEYYDCLSSFLRAASVLDDVVPTLMSRLKKFLEDFLHTTRFGQLI